MLFAERQVHGEGRSLAEGAFDGNQAFMQLRQLLHESKADAGTFMGAAACALDAMKAVENER